MNENEINSMELEVYTKIIINNNIKTNALIFFQLLTSENYHKIITIKIIKISQFSHHLFAVNGKVDTEK